MSALNRISPLRMTVTLVAAAALGTLGLAPATASTGVAATPAPAAHVATSKLPDPAKKGPHAVKKVQYDLGDTAYTPPALGHAVEVIGEIFYPKDLTNGPYPLVIFMHGRHSTCYSGSQSYLDWPCPSGTQMIPSYLGYNYMAKNLASWGYIVDSISADGINAWDNDTSDLGALARAQLIQYHLNLWNSWDTKGAKPFKKKFVGTADMQDIGLMGHSRGGEGVMQEWLYNQQQGSPYGIKAIVAIAPTDFNRQLVTDVPISVLLGYCDGDVSDNQGIHYYDDSLYGDPDDDTMKNDVSILGANHNFFNTVWTPGDFPAGTADDWSGNPSDPVCSPSAQGTLRLSAAQQRQVGLDYVNGFLRMNLGAESAMLPYFNGSGTQPKSIKWAHVHEAYQAPANQRLTVDNFMTSSDLTTDALGGAVTESGLSPFDLCGGASEPSPCTSAGQSQQPHTVPSDLSSKPGLSQLRFAWSKKTAQMTAALPSGTGDVSGYQDVSFRIAQNITASNPNEDMSVVLTDGSGDSMSVDADDWSDALFQQQGDTSGLTPKLLLSEVRIPLSAFTGVDLTDVTKITLAFDQTKSGSVLMTDLAFND